MGIVYWSYFFSFRKPWSSISRPQLLEPVPFDSNLEMLHDFGKSFISRMKVLLGEDAGKSADAGSGCLRNCGRMLEICSLIFL